MSRTSPNFAPALGSASPMLANGAVSNGRVDLMSPLPSFDIPSYQTRNVNNTSYPQEALQGQITSNPLSNLYFSAENIDALQQGIRYRIYQETNGKHVIGRQSDQELKIVMRSIYFQYAKHQSLNLVQQVRELNAKVLEWVVPEILSNLRQYEIYRRDASSLPMPLEHAQLQTKKGTKTLEIKSFM